MVVVVVVVMMMMMIVVVVVVVMMMTMMMMTTMMQIHRTGAKYLREFSFGDISRHVGHKQRITPNASSRNRNRQSAVMLGLTVDCCWNAAAFQPMEQQNTCPEHHKTTCRGSGGAGMKCSV